MISRRINFLFGEVASGEASFSNVGNEFQITASDGAVINYGILTFPPEKRSVLSMGTDASVINQIGSPGAGSPSNPPKSTEPFWEMGV